jgi:tRNA(Ile)-lysidine synthase
MSSTGNVDAKVEASRAFLDGLSLHPEDRILVAFSGGPDSTALLFFLHGQLDNPSDRIGAGYFNHNLRGGCQSKLEDRHIAGLTDRWGIRLHCGQAEVGEIQNYAKDERISIEEAARILRYRFLRATADAGGYRYIATGHTGDDQVETLIQRFFQGSGVWGLCGIPQKAERIVRPLLNWSRADVEAFNARIKVEPFHDSSNSKTMYLRNAIRHLLIPVVKDLFPDFNRSVEALGTKMSITREFLNVSIASKVQWRREADTYVFPVADFVKLHALERIESVRRMLDTARESDGATVRIPFHAFKELVDLPRMHDNKILFRNQGYRLQIHGCSVVFEPDVVFDKGKGYFKVVHESKRTGWSDGINGVGLRIAVANRPDKTSIPIESISYPLVVRSRREGDTISVGGISKDLKKMYNEWNVPEQERWKIPVCEDRSGIIAVIGNPFGFGDIRRFSCDPVEEGLFYTFGRMSGEQ